LAVVDEKYEVLPHADNVGGHGDITAPPADRDGAVPLDDFRGLTVAQTCDRSAVEVETALGDAVRDAESTVPGCDQAGALLNRKVIGLGPTAATGFLAAWMQHEPRVLLIDPRHRRQIGCVLGIRAQGLETASYPGMWSLPGGMLEEGETPAECIRREIAEEIGVVLDPEKVEHVRTRDLHYGLEHAFFARIDFEIDQVVLTEGQRLGWFDETTSAATTLAYEDNAILAEFFAGLPQPETTR
jgi:8-oxo-dGTP diphosphatase